MRGRLLGKTDSVMTKTDVLDKWMEIYGSLTAEQRSSFLAKPELDVLTALPDAAVLYGISRSPKLAETTRLAQRDGWWFAGRACDQDNIEWCARCKPTGFPTTVYMTKGWSSAFHRSATCQMLSAGQRFVAAVGGNPASVEPTHIQVALGSGRFPCRSCFP